MTVLVGNHDFLTGCKLNGDSVLNAEFCLEYVEISTNGVIGICAVPLMSDVVVIKYAFWGNPDALGVEKDIIEAFEKENPGIKVQPIVSPYSEYHTKLLVMIAGGMSPDVFRINSSFFLDDFLRIKALRDLTSLIKRDKIKLNLYYPLGLEECMSKGRYYGLPWGTAPCYLAVNLKVFKEAGLSVPSYDWTWDDFVDICKKLSKKTETDQVFAYADTFVLENVLPFIWGTGVDLFDKTRTKFTLNLNP